MLTAKLSIGIKGELKGLDKQTTFALASALTAVAKEAQPAIRKQIRSSFTVRTNWDERGPFAVKVQAATKQKLYSIVGTGAEFLEKFVRATPGSFVVKLPAGEFLAIPTKNVRRTKRDIVQKSQRPRSLLGKRDFIIVTKRGVRVIFQRKGRGARSEMIAMYILVPRARIQEKDVLFGVSQKVFTTRFAPIFAQQMERALATAR